MAAPLGLRVGIAVGCGLFVALLLHFNLRQAHGWRAWAIGGGGGLALFLIGYIPLPENSQDSEGFDR